VLARDVLGVVCEEFESWESVVVKDVSMVSLRSDSEDVAGEGITLAEDVDPLGKVLEVTEEADGCFFDWSKSGGDKLISCLGGVRECSLDLVFSSKEFIDSTLVEDFSLCDS
jgi:hypothetical protein